MSTFQTTVGYEVFQVLAGDFANEKLISCKMNPWLLSQEAKVKLRGGVAASMRVADPLWRRNDPMQASDDPSANKPGIAHRNFDLGELHTRER